MELRRGDLRDLPVLLRFHDEAVAWMVARGNTEQWGTEPWSEDQAKAAGVSNAVAEGALWLAEIDGEPVGALVVTDTAPAYAKAAPEPELYVRILISSRRHAGKKIGSALLAFAREHARNQGIGLIRLDCYAGGTGDLVRYYINQGFTPTEPFNTITGWPGQLLEQRV
jgi:GNAT superfamily N-acetyltransferase